MKVMLFERLRLRHIAGIAAVCYLASMTPFVGIGGDEARYILESREIAANGFAHFKPFEMLPYSLLRFLLVPFALCVPEAYAAMKVIPFAATIGCLVLFNAYMRRSDVAPALRAFVLALYAFNAWTVEYSTLLLTEMPFTCLVLAAAVCVRRHEILGKRRDVLLAAAGAGIALYCRPAGIVVAAALLWYWIRRRKMKETAFSLLVIAGIGAGFIAYIPEIVRGTVSQIIAKQYYYQPEPSKAGMIMLPLRMAYHLAVYAGNYLPDLMLKPLVSWIEPRSSSGIVNAVFVLKALIGVLLAVIIVRGARRSEANGPFPHIFVALYLFFCLMLNAYVARYLLPILPFMVLWMVKGMSPEGKNVPGRGAHPWLAGAVIVCALWGSAAYIFDARRGYLPPAERIFIACNRWIAGYTPPSAVILSRKPYYTTLVTGRKAVGYTFSDTSAAQLAYMRAHGVDYVIAADAGCFLRSGRFVDSAIGSQPGSFTRVFSATGSTANGHVYKADLR